MTNSYDNWFAETFGTRRPAPNTSVVTSWDFAEPWGKAALHALLKVEYDYVQSLIAELMAADVPGAIVEFGVSSGHWLGKLAEFRETFGFKREVFGFDSFEGLPVPDPDVDMAWFKEGQYLADLESVSRALRTETRPWLTLVKGWYSDTLQQETARNIEHICFARLDSDLYKSSSECLSYLTDRLVKGSILVFDDWTYSIDKGETKAFREWHAQNPEFSFEFLCFTTLPGHVYFRVTGVPEPATKTSSEAAP